MTVINYDSNKLLIMFLLLCNTYYNITALFKLPIITLDIACYYYNNGQGRYYSNNGLDITHHNYL